MNKLSYRKLDEKQEKITESCPDLGVILDGQKLGYCFDEPALAVSAEKDGVYPILNCGCGEMGCGGAYVQVRNKKNIVIWDKLFNRFYDEDDYDEEEPDQEQDGYSDEFKELKNKLPFSFDRKEYEDLIKIFRDKADEEWTLDRFEEICDRYRKAGIHLDVSFFLSEGDLYRITYRPTSFFEEKIECWKKGKGWVMDNGANLAEIWMGMSLSEEDAQSLIKCREENKDWYSKSGASFESADGRE